MATEKEIEEAAISMVEQMWGIFWHQLPEASKHYYRYVANVALDRVEKLKTGQQ